MSCGTLATTLDALRMRSARKPAFAAVLSCMTRGRRLRWRQPSGCYTLCRGLAADTIDSDYPVGVAPPGSVQIAEVLDNRPVTDGDLYYAVRAYSPLGAEDDAAPPANVKLTLVAGVVQLPAPNPPLPFHAEPTVGGKFRIVATVDNYGATVPAATLVVYTDGGTGAMDWNAPLGNSISVGSGARDYVAEFDPALAHGTVIQIGVHAKSAAGGESANTNTVEVVLDSQGPAPVELTVEIVC